jgi:iron-sulfur cluster assembly protein
MSTCQTEAASMDELPSNTPTQSKPITGLKATEKAGNHIKRFIAKRGRGIGIRLSVKTTGCSGLAYVLEYADEKITHDLMFESQGIKIFVDPKSLVYLDGTEIDFTREGLNEGFKFSNPNVRNACGCGESFNV